MQKCENIYIWLLVILGILIVLSGVMFFKKGAYWPAFGCICLLMVIVNINKITELGFGDWHVKFKELVNTLLLEKRQIEQLDVKIEDKTAYVDLQKEPAPNLIDAHADNLFILPETYSIQGKRIIFDTKKESGLLQGGRITVIYYDKASIENIVK